jgi:hypothetical protein
MKAKIFLQLSGKKQVNLIKGKKICRVEVELHILLLIKYFVQRPSIMGKWMDFTTYQVCGLSDERHRFDQMFLLVFGQLVLGSLKLV